jgi:endogenous inhibitor of DNA gyrase (YacG/DUF329 family)
MMEDVVMEGTCPYCKKDIDSEIYDAWSGDYWTHTDDFECPECGKQIDIDVEQSPIFVCKKAS